VAGGFLIGLLLGRVAARAAIPFGTILSTAGLALLALWLTFLVHELGHLAVGVLGRFRTILFVAWPLEFRREGARMRLSFRLTAPPGSAFVALVPREGGDLRRRMLAMTAGGPATSLVTGLAALAAWWTWEPGRFVALFAFISLLVAGFSVWPRQMAGLPNDGARLLRLRRRGPEADQEAALLALAGASYGGMRPREWDGELVRRAGVGSDDPLLRLAGRMALYAHLLDQDRVEEARRYLESALEDLESFPEPGLAGLLLEAAWFLAYHGRDAMRARSLLARATDALLVSPHQRPLAEAALALAEGSPERAVERAAQARAALARAADRGEALVAADRIEELVRSVREGGGAILRPPENGA
jgi:hypothetical protein